MTHVAFIGRTEFEDVNGRLMFVATWELPKALRPLEVTLSCGTFAAQRQTGDGTWVYRWVRDKHPNEHVDPYVTGIHDEPRPAPPALTLKEVREMLDSLIVKGSKEKNVVNVKLLRPVSDMLKELERA